MTILTITLPWTYMAAVKASTATKDPRPFTKGFAVLADPDTHEICICGTQGTLITLARTGVNAPEDFPAAGLVFAFPEILPKGNNANGDVTLELDLSGTGDSTMWWRGVNRPVYLPVIDAKFPDIWRFFKNYADEPAQAVGLNTLLLAPIQRALKAKACRASFYPSLEIMRADWTDPAKVTTIMSLLRT